MRQLVPTLAAVVLLATAGCAGFLPASPATETPTSAPTPPTTEHPTPTGATPATTTSTATTQTDTRTTSVTVANTSSEYVVQTADVPPEFASLNVTFEVLYAERYEEVANCPYPAIIGPNEPTPTPLKSPSGACEYVAENDAGERLAADLVGIDTRSLGTVSGPAFPEGGQALLVTNVTGRLEDGTRVTQLGDEHFIAHRTAIDNESAGTARYVVSIGSASSERDGDVSYYMTVEGQRAYSFVGLRTS